MENACTHLNIEKEVTLKQQRTVLLGITMQILFGANGHRDNCSHHLGLYINTSWGHGYASRVFNFALRKTYSARELVRRARLSQMLTTQQYGVSRIDSYL